MPKKITDPGEQTYYVSYAHAHDPRGKVHTLHCRYAGTGHGRMRKRRELMFADVANCNVCGGMRDVITLKLNEYDFQLLENALAGNMPQDDHEEKAREDLTGYLVKVLRQRGLQK